ncbi:hypothetical protein WJX75_001097 [Coccomyxa subellipsoidea]|uniref:Right handed beta helix domain-containing protein n=1 Tax=Coccomyxa subellipsoidea TaxID=248742 RepID=A0ABR2Z349_9CHLO
MAGWLGELPYGNSLQDHKGKQYPANMLDQVTQGIAGLAQPSDHLEYAAKGRGMLVYPISGPELDGESFRRFWNAAHKNKAVSGIRLPPGEYHLKPPESIDYLHLHMACKEDGDDRTSPFVMDLSGTFLWLTSKTHHGIGVVKGENVELRGPFAVCNNLDSWSFGQATLVSYDKETLEWIVHGHDGYPNDRVFLTGRSINATIWDPVTRLVKDPDLHDLRTRKIEKIGPNRYKMTLEGRQEYNINPGDYLTARGDGPNCMILESCTRCIVRGATIHTAFCFGFYDSFGRANEYRDCCIMPYPRPIGNDSQLPLMSTCADGMHCTDDAEGPRLINCYFGGLLDDAIAIHGHFAPVLAACTEENYIILCQNRKGLFADKGEPLLAYAVEGACKGTARIARVEECDNPLPKDTNIPNLGMENVENERCTKVFLEEWPHEWGGMCIGCVVEVPTWTGSDYQILGCRVYNVRGNGVVARGSRGTIADSTFTHLKGFAIEVNPQYNGRESGFVHDLVIRNNTIDSLGQGIWVGGSQSTSADPTPFHHNSNIVIEGNYIAHSWRTPLIVTSARQVSVCGNTLRNCLPRRFDVDLDTRGHDWEVDDKLMLFIHVDQLSLSNNRFVKDEPREFRGDYAVPIEFKECSNVVHEPDTIINGSHPTYYVV